MPPNAMMIAPIQIHGTSGFQYARMVQLPAVSPSPSAT